MSTPTDDGGPIHPCQPLDAQGTPMGPLECGMTLRDWFAGQALASIAAHTVMVEESGVAEKCYKMADAMLAARKENK